MTYGKEKSVRRFSANGVGRRVLGFLAGCGGSGTPSGLPLRLRCPPAPLP